MREVVLGGLSVLAAALWTFSLFAMGMSLYHGHKATRALRELQRLRRGGPLLLLAAALLSTGCSRASAREPVPDVSAQVERLARRAEVVLGERRAHAAAVETIAEVCGFAGVDRVEVSGATVAGTCWRPKIGGRR